MARTETESEILPQKNVKQVLHPTALDQVEGLCQVWNYPEKFETKEVIAIE